MSSFYNQEERFSHSGEGITHAVHRLIMLNVLIFALQLVVHIFAGTRSDALLSAPFYEWIAFSPAKVLNGALWTPLTYMFLHSNLMHLLGNMIGLLIFGPTVERVLGTRQFYTFYLLCGAVGVLASFLPIVPYNAIVVGASGATLGMLVGSAILDPDRRIILFPIPIPITVKGILIFTVAINMVGLLDANSGVSVLTHFGGMIVAYGYMKGRPKWTRLQLGRKEKKLRTKVKKSSKQEEEMADAVDNIFDFKNK